MTFDLAKHGLEQQSSHTFAKRVDGTEISVYKEGNRFSLFINSFIRQHKRCVAEQYRCENQKQLDFLLTNGPAEYFFNQQTN